VSTHPRVFDRPLRPEAALRFLTPILGCDLVTVLVPTARHQALLAATVKETGRLAGNVFHDVHTAVLMREHGVREIMTADRDFRMFDFLRVTDPTRP
jgi:uncharacterized protein